jgi:hypothetical protein
MMKVLKVLAIDPGVTTGFAQMMYVGGYIGLDYRQRKLSPKQFGEFVLRMKSLYHVCESFQYRQGQFQKDVLFPVELIGVLKYLVGEGNPNQQLWMQPPSVQGKKSAFYSDEKIKAMGLWMPGREHGRSALKHLLHWFKFSYGSELIKPDDKFILTDLVW